MAWRFESLCGGRDLPCRDRGRRRLGWCLRRGRRRRFQGLPACDAEPGAGSGQRTALRAADLHRGSALLTESRPRRALSSASWAAHSASVSVPRIRSDRPYRETFSKRNTIESLHIIVTVPVLLDLLLCHSRAWLQREESRSFPTSFSGIRDSSRAPDTRAGMTEKFDRADVRVTILCRTQIRSLRRALKIRAQAVETVLQHPAKRLADEESAPEIGGPAAAGPHTARDRERRSSRIARRAPWRAI